MKKPYAVYNSRTNKMIEFFEYPIQAERYIGNRLSDSKAFSVIDIRRKNAKRN